MAQSESSMEVEDGSSDQYGTQSVDLSQFSGTFNLEDYEVTTMDLSQAMQFFGDDLGLGPNSAQHNSHVDSFLDECEKVGDFLKCPFTNCPYQTNIRNNMKSHFRYVHGEKKYRCNHCDYQSASRRNVTRHEQVHVKALLDAAFTGDESKLHLLPLPDPPQQHQHHQQQQIAAPVTQGLTASKLFLNQRAANKRASQVVQRSSGVISTATVSSTTLASKPVTIVSTPDFAAVASAMTSQSPSNQQNEREPTPELDAASTSKTSFASSPDSAFRCKLCPVAYSRSYDLHLHIRSAHKGIHAYACGHCLESFRTLSELTEHMKEDHGVCHAGHNLYPCEICDAKCLTAAVYQEHMKAYHKSALIRQCQQCSFKATTNASLNHHMMTEHAVIPSRPSSSKKLYACSKCLFRSQERDAVSRHIKTVHRKVPHPTAGPAPESERFESPPSGPPPPKKLKYKCTRCGFIASSIEEFKIHSRSCKNAIDRLLKEGAKSVTLHNTTITLVDPKDPPRKNLELNGGFENEEEMTIRPTTKNSYNTATTFKLALQDGTKFEDEDDHEQDPDPYSMLSTNYDREEELDISTYGDPLADYDDPQDDEEEISPSPRSSLASRTATSSNSAPLSVRQVVTSLTDTLEEVANSEIVIQDDQGTHPYKCQFCQFDTGNIIKLFHHVMKHTGKQFFKCRCSSCRVGVGHSKPVSVEHPRVNGVFGGDKNEGT